MGRLINYRWFGASPTKNNFNAFLFTATDLSALVAFVASVETHTPSVTPVHTTIGENPSIVRLSRHRGLVATGIFPAAFGYTSRHRLTMNPVHLLLSLVL